MTAKAFALGLGALLVASTPFAQRPAKAALYTRAEQGVVRAALEIQLDAGWHIYHGPTQADLGHPKAVGSPTVVTLSGTGIEWSAVRFPEPIKIDQSELVPGAFILALNNAVFVLAIVLMGSATAANIVYSVRGLFSVVAVWAIGHWFTNDEKHLAPGVLRLRFAGAGLMVAAIVLVLV